MADDLELLRRFVERGEEGAFAEVVGNNARWLFAAAYRQLGDRGLAEDAVQGVFVLLAQRAESAVRTGRVAGWLFRTLQYVVKNLRRSEGARRRREAAAREMVREREVVMDDSNELAEVLDGAVERLPGKYREAVVMRFYREMGFEEVARALGTSEAGARKRVERGLEMLRGTLGAGVSGAAVSAGVMHGSSFVPAGLGETAARVALSAKAGVAVPVGVAASTKGAVAVMAMTKAKIAAAVVAAGLVVVPTAVVVRKWSAPAGPVVPAGTGVASTEGAVGKFTVSVETTGIVSPLRADGRPDYIAAMNERCSRGVTPENNAYVGWMELTGTGNNLISVRIRDQAIRMSGANPPAKGMAFVTYNSVLKKLGMDMEQAAINADTEAERVIWREDQYPAVAEWMKENGAFLDAMAEVWKRPRYWFPAVADASGSPMMVLLPSLGPMREAGNALTARAMLRAGHGDFERFLGDVETVQRMARRLASSYSVIEGLVGYALDAQVSRAIGAAAGSGVLTGEQGARLMKTIDEAEPLGTVVERVDVFERWSDLDFELMVALGRLEDMAQTFNAKEFEKQYGMFETVDVGSVNWDRVLRETNADFDGEVAALKLRTVAEMRGALKALLAKHKAVAPGTDLGRENGESEEAYSGRVEGAILGMLFADLGRSGEIERQTKMQEEMARAVVVAAAYKAEKGKWPEGLEGLVPGYLREVPADVYSKSGGEGVRYAVGERGVRVYSVGRNGVDDGGIGDDLVVGVVERSDGL